MTGAGTTHTSVTTAETWTAADSPHLVTSDMGVSAQLTLDPCAVVKISAGVTITVQQNGSIVANGTASQSVVIEPAVSGANWASIRLIGGTAHLTYTSVTGGGAPLNSVPDFQAALDVRSAQATLTAPDPVLFVDHVAIQGSATQGVYAHSGGGFTADSQFLSISGSAAHAATFSANVVGTLPTGTYAGNAMNDILLLDGEPIRNWDVTMHDRAIPYYSGGINQMGVATVGGITNIVTLTIEPGVVWKFKKDTGLLQLDLAVGQTTPSHAILIAKGTAAKPIVFTSNEPTPAAGDWLGVWMGATDPTNSLDYVQIKYAGKLDSSVGSSSCQSKANGTTSNGGALRVYRLPPATLLTNSTISDSATNAIDRGWSDDTMPSFLSGNTFTNVTLCNETMPSATNGSCPANPTCPK